MIAGDDALPLVALHKKLAGHELERLRQRIAGEYFGYGTAAAFYFRSAELRPLGDIVEFGGRNDRTGFTPAEMEMHGERIEQIFLVVQTALALGIVLKEVVPLAGLVQFFRIVCEMERRESRIRRDRGGSRTRLHC